MTTNFDLIHFAKILKIKNFRYIMTDEVEDLPMKNFSAIMNYQLSNQEGSHHVGLYQKGDSKMFYFDSYGMPVQNQIIKKFRGNIRTHDYIIQKPNTELCGQMSLFVIFLLDRGIPFEDIIFFLKNELHFN